MRIRRPPEAGPLIWVRTRGGYSLAGCTCLGGWGGPAATAAP